MKKLTYLLVATAFFAAAPFVIRLGAFPASLATVLLAASLAVAASGSFDALALALGATAAFAGSVMGTVSAPIGTAVLVALVFGERTTRVREPRARLAHIGLALVSGAGAGAIAQAYRGMPLPTFAVAALVAAVLVAAPFFVEADDTVAHALDLASREARGPVAEAFARGAELRRTTQDVPLDRATAKEVAETWRALVGLASARLRLDRGRLLDTKATSATTSVLAKLDVRIAQHVDVLARTYTAVDTAHAAALGADDRAVRRVALEGDALDETSQALIDVDAGLDEASPRPEKAAST